MSPVKGLCRLHDAIADFGYIVGALGLASLAAGVSVYSYGDGVASGGDADEQLGDSSGEGKPKSTMSGLLGDATTQAHDDTVDKELLSSSDNEHVRNISAMAQAFTFSHRSLRRLWGMMLARSLPRLSTSRRIGETGRKRSTCRYFGATQFTQ